jgi:hypothetical protein
MIQAAKACENEPSTTIRTARGSDGRVRVTVPVYQSRHTAILGSTGAGKTKCSENLSIDYLWQGVGIGAIDFKSDLYPTCRQWLGAYAYGLAEAECLAFTGSLLIVNPFASDALLPFNVCQEFVGRSTEVQCYEIATSLSRLFDQGRGSPLQRGRDTKLFRRSDLAPEAVMNSPHLP